MSSSRTYPEAFNPNPPKFKPGDKVINRMGEEGIVIGPYDFSDYEFNRPGKKWELVKYSKRNRPTWIGNIWLKLR